MIAVGELPTKACVKSMHAFCFPVNRFIAIAYAFGETGSTRSVVFRRLGDSELMHVMAKSAKKGRRDAEDAEVAGLAWWFL